jgi:hypothetical protein
MDIGRSGLGRRFGEHVEKKQESVFARDIQVCSRWRSLTKLLDELPKPVVRRDEDGEADQQGWIFRGHSSHKFSLQPSIERAYPYRDWPEAEYRLLREFQSKAAMHMEPTRLPPFSPEYKLSWLSIMQHYGAPTRLLDFTYSPYVALYFALRNREKGHAAFAEVWGFDSVALRRRAAIIIREANHLVKKSQNVPPTRRVLMSPENFSSSLQRAQEEDDFWEAAMRDALNPGGIQREHFNQKGLITVALPPIQNSRLSSQQGVFLFNAAEDLTFEESLYRMMGEVQGGWYRRFRVPEKVLTQMEEHLFQVNIHDLSLFPDAEGLAGFVRQKLRLYW